MRVQVLPIVAATVLLAVSPGPAAAQSKPPEPVKTPEQAKRESLEGAVTTPLRDLNVLKTKIPPILLEAFADPYARPPKNWKCAQLIALIKPLDDALGPDLDRLPAGDEDLTERTRETAFGAAADFAADAIPFRGWVRKLTGAERHDNLVRSAIVAGDVRRAYLKGLGEARGCNPPATPSHERAGMPVPDDRRFKPMKPLYPTKRPEPQKTSGTPQDGPR